MNASQSRTYTSAKHIVVIAKSLIPAKSRWVHCRADGLLPMTRLRIAGPKIPAQQVIDRPLSQIAAGFAGGFFFCFCRAR
jgi:hypothetical protein